MIDDEETARPKKIVIDVPAAKAAFERWLARGDAIGVFQNQDMCSQHLGHVVFLPLTPEEQRSAELHKTHAPDSAQYGLGWRYLLQSIETSLDVFEFKAPG